MVLLAGWALVSCWYISPIGLFLQRHFELLPLIWTLSIGEWLCAVVAGLIVRDVPSTLLLTEVWEYGFLFLACGNQSFDLYPFMEVVLATGTTARVLAATLAVSCALGYILWRNGRNRFRFLKYVIGDFYP